MPEHDALERGRDRAGVGDVVAEVGAVVDPGDDQVGALAEQPEVGEAHAVDRGALGGEADGAVVELDLLDPDRRVGGDQRAVPLRLVCGAITRTSTSVDLGERASQGVQARGADAVVVCQQDDHLASDREVRTAAELDATARVNRPRCEISVVVPTRDRPASLARCLAALAARRIALEVGRRRRRLARPRRGVARRCGACRHEGRRTPGRGPAAARNLGARAPRASSSASSTTTATRARAGLRRSPAPQRCRDAADGRGGRAHPRPAGRAPVAASQAIVEHLTSSSLDRAGATARLRPHLQPRGTRASCCGSCRSTSPTRTPRARTATGARERPPRASRSPGEPDAVVVHHQSSTARAASSASSTATGAARRGFARRAGAAAGAAGFLCGAGAPRVRAGPAVGGLVVAAQVADRCGGGGREVRRWAGGAS